MAGLPHLWVLELGLLVVLAGYGRLLFGRQARAASDTLAQVDRFRSMGADAERIRIARDIHDRVGQSLAYVAFSLEQLAAGSEPDRDGPLSTLRSEVRGVLSEVRETLSDLRTDVTDARGIAATLSTFLDRVADRSGLEVHLVSEESQRLDLRSERELWRMAQEAIANAERHAAATTVDVTWFSDGTSARLGVTDDGRGFDPADPGPDSYGIQGMAERAESIGALLEIRSRRHSGTQVTVTISADSGRPPSRHPTIRL
ncbi:MAG: sensor histidine kinase [Acidimicrobiales bacterium]